MPRYGTRAASQRLKACAAKRVPAAVCPGAASQARDYDRRLFRFKAIDNVFETHRSQEKASMCPCMCRLAQSIGEFDDPPMAVGSADGDDRHGSGSWPARHDPSGLESPRSGLRALVASRSDLEFWTLQGLIEFWTVSEPPSSEP